MGTLRLLTAAGRAGAHAAPPDTCGNELPYSRQRAGGVTGKDETSDRGERLPHGGSVVTPAEVEEKVMTIVSEQMAINKAEITRETSFVNDLNADSLDIVELVMEFEDNFEMSIPDEEAEKIKTVGQAIDYIVANYGKGKTEK
jgi:acyl carrier protein